MHVRSISLALAFGLPSVAAQQVDDLDARVRSALDRSRPVLLKKLGSAHGGELALLCLAAVHDAIPRNDEVLVKAMKRLSRTTLSRTYDVSLRLMVASEYAWLPGRKALVIADRKRLLRNITNDGGFDYGPKRKRWDLSNSQYGALGLRAAIAMGAEIDSKIWTGLLRTAIAAQNENGGFGYTTGGRTPTSSMTVAGIAMMQLCKDYLDAATVKSFAVEKHLRVAWEFLVEHKGEIGDRKTENCFYFHYGLERSCILSDLTDVDGKEWYRAGAEMFLRTQLAGGGWRSMVDHIQGGPDADGSDSVSTSFAILFLRRKFKKIAAPITPSSSLSIGQLTMRSSEVDIDLATKASIARGRGSLPGVLRALRSRIKVQRIAGARALIGITGKDFGFNPHVPPEKSRSAATKAELWWLKTKRVPKNTAK